jgi:excisionase family DNA binding protein
MPTARPRAIEPTAKLLTAADLAHWLNLPRSTIYKLCQERGIPAAKIGRHWRFDKSAITRWLESRMSLESNKKPGARA